MPILVEHTGSGGLKAVSFAQITVSTTALALTLPEGAGVKRAIISCETNNIRYRTDGGNPTAGAGGTGHLLPVGGTLELIGFASISAFKMIRGAAADAVAMVTLEV